MCTVTISASLRSCQRRDVAQHCGKRKERRKLPKLSLPLVFEFLPTTLDGECAQQKECIWHVGGLMQERREGTLLDSKSPRTVEHKPTEYACGPLITYSLACASTSSLRSIRSSG